MDNPLCQSTDKQEEEPEQLDFIKGIFLPRKTTSLIQPMDQLINANFQFFTQQYFLPGDLQYVRLLEWPFNIFIIIRRIIKAWQEVKME